MIAPFALLALLIVAVVVFLAVVLAFSVAAVWTGDLIRLSQAAGRRG